MHSGTRNPLTMKRSNLPLELFKTIYFTLGAVFDGDFTTVIAVYTFTV
jgi:hypothetical protein